MYNKKQYGKANNKKILHKVRKRWVAISLALFLLIGGGAVTSHVTASANSLNHQQPVAQARQGKAGQASASNITNGATWLHTELVNNSTKQSLRLGGRRGRSHRILRSRYSRSNNRYLLKKSGYRRHGGFVFNRYAPNDRKAVIPKRLSLRYFTWAEGRFGRLNLKLFTHKRNGWITVNPHNARRYRSSLRAIYKAANRRHHSRRASGVHVNYVSRHIYNRYNRQLRNYRYSMHHGSRWARRSNQRAYYALKNRMRYVRIRKARKHRYSKHMSKNRSSNKAPAFSSSQPSATPQPSDGPTTSQSDGSASGDNIQPASNVQTSAAPQPSDGTPSQPGSNSTQTSSSSSQPSDRSQSSSSQSLSTGTAAQPSDKSQPSDNQPSADQSSDNAPVNTAQIMQDAKQETLNDINNERQANGAQPLTESADLDRLANLRAQQASTNFTHYSSDGSTLESDDAQRLGIGLDSYNAENLADNFGDNGRQVADNANDDMMNHDADSNWGHRDNILNPDMKYIGIGVAPAQGEYQGDYTIAEDFTD